MITFLQLNPDTVGLWIFFQNSGLKRNRQELCKTLPPSQKKWPKSAIFRCHGVREGPQFEGSTSDTSKSRTTVTKMGIAHTVLDQTAWLAPLWILWNKVHVLGQKIPSFMHFWVSGRQSKCHETLEIWQIRQFSPNQRTLGTPKPPQMSPNVVPPHAL